MTGSPWSAEEIVQDVFTTLMREPRKYDAARGALGGYLFGIARNRVMKHLERLPREISLEEHSENGSENARPAAAVSTFTPAHWAEQQERVEQVRAAVLELPTEFREAVALCDFFSRLHRGLQLVVHDTVNRMRFHKVCANHFRCQNPAFWPFLWSAPNQVGRAKFQITPNFLANRYPLAVDRGPAPC